MRIVQIILLVIGVGAFLAALGFLDDDTGETLWRVGVAALLTDLVVIKLWERPAGPPKGSG